MPDGLAPNLNQPGERLTGWTKTRTGDIWLTTNQRALVRKGGNWQKLDLPRAFKFGQMSPHVDSELRQVVATDGGVIWIATSEGVCATDGDIWWQPMNRADGMPYEDVNCLAVAPNGDVWGGTSQGAWRLRSGTWTYYWGKRWMPGNVVNSITVDKGGAVWLATNGGVAKIEETVIRLKDKAAHYEQITQARHNRNGWVTSAGIKVPGDITKGIMPEASDNDGLWTAMYVASECFRYGTTKDPEAKKFAKASMKALLDLVRLSGYPGFPARAILRKDEVASGYDPNETVRVAGETDKIWYTSPLDKNLLIKGDTSSDELDGHYFAWYLYHELVADATEKKELAAIVRAVTNNILDHEYTLVGHTGRKTLWGVFGPQFINDDPRWFQERGLNSIELLCYLKTAHYICGDERFAKAYEDLITNHHYLLNTLLFRRGETWFELNHSDDELGYCAYYPLLMLEKDPSRLAILRKSITGTWQGVAGTPGIGEEGSPFYNFLYGALTGEQCKSEHSVQSLQTWPWELINWRVQNSHRHDVEHRTGKGTTRKELTRVLPPSERDIMRWNGNPWSPDGGDDGRSEEDGAAWLIGYWMGRFHGFIEE
jgi:hypothetical protein